MNIKNLVRKAVLQMKTAHWAVSAEEYGIRLNFGENPYIFKPVLKAIKKELPEINTYPDPDKSRLKSSLARYNRIKIDNIFPGNGTEDLIRLIASTFIEQDDEVLTVAPSMPSCQNACTLMGANIKLLRLDSDFSLSLHELFKNITKATKIIWIPNPNDLTGNILLKVKEIEDILKNFGGILVIDESFYEFSGVTANSLLRKYPNLIILRSFSKAFGIAGLRLGYLLTSPDIMEYIHKTAGSTEAFSVNRLAQVAGSAILSNIDAAKKFVERFQKEKLKFEKSLSRLKGVEVIPTETSFVLLRTPVKSAELTRKLEKVGVLVHDTSEYKYMNTHVIYLGLPNKWARRYVKRWIKKYVKIELKKTK